MKNPKFIFFGSTDFSVIILEELAAAGYIAQLIVCAPDKPIGRKQIVTPPPVKVWAEENNISVFQPSSFKNVEPSNLPARIVKAGFNETDIFIIASYALILPKEILDIPKKGVLNIHPSLLPKYRGPSPIQYAILKGESETGVTIMLTDEKMDHGPIITQRKLPLIKSQITTDNQWKSVDQSVEISELTYYELHDQLAHLGGKLLVQTLPKYLMGEIKSIPQDHSKATFSKILKKEDGHIDWKKPAQEIERRIRAFIKWPTSYTFWKHNNKKIRLVITKATARPSESDKGRGVVYEHKNQLVVACGKGALVIERLIPEGKREMTSEEFLRGNKGIIDTILC